VTSPLQYILAALAAFAAGLINALAGGGTLITFPALTALGLPAVVANITSTVSLFPGYFGATWAQRNDLRDQGSRLKILLPAALVGGLAGGHLLLHTGEKVFKQLVPFLILFASLLLALSDPLRRKLGLKSQASSSPKQGARALIAMVTIALAAVYGGYFGAGLSVIVLALLALLFEDNLTHLNALKQSIAFAANTAAAIVFLFSGQIRWGVVGVMAVSALLGGSAGGKLAGRINPVTLRWIVVTIGLIVSLVFFVQIYFLR
jgi:uncharacterized membrane protein YfcA